MALNMIFAAAQTIPHQENITENLNDHIRLINLAADRGAGLVLFPELSLTGYEREKAGLLAFASGDPRLGVLRSLAISRNIIIIAGAPIRLDPVLHIGAYILYPNGTEAVYTKQYLHEGEEKFYGPGVNDGLLINGDRERISLAICADINNRAHPVKAASLNSTLYAASIFYTPNGIGEGYEKLGSYASEFSMPVLMSNFGGTSYGLEAAGRSAFWDEKGRLAGCFEGAGEGLLLAEKVNGHWETAVVKTKRP
jgi:predicted amidohydrolase